jgi:DNA-binding PucR family transcriptional regulator
MTSPVLRAFVSRLTPAQLGDIAPVATGNPAELAAAVEVLGERPARWAIAMAQRSCDLVLATVRPERRPVLEPHLRRAIEQSALDLLLILAGHGGLFSLNPEQQTIVAYLARADVPFERNMHGMRIIQRHWMSVLLDAVTAHHNPASERTALTRLLAEAVTGYFDESVDAVVASYAEERQRLIAQQITSRRELAASIITGGTPDPTAVRRTLGIDLSLQHLAMVVWPRVAATARDHHRELEHAAHQAAELAACPAPLTVTGEDGTLWAWASRRQPFTAADLKALTTLRPGPACAAFGIPGGGAEGFRRGHLTATDACRLARAAGVAGPVVFHRDHSLAALLTADRERAAWFVQEELGALAASEPAVAALRATLVCYLDNGASLVRTAAAMHVHRNTVVYRLRRIEDLLGRPVTDRTLQVHAALLLARLLPAQPDRVSGLPGTARIT